MSGNYPFITTIKQIDYDLFVYKLRMGHAWFIHILKVYIYTTTLLMGHVPALEKKSNIV